MPLTDKHGRTLTDLRVSITDRCNYRCVYCRSGEENVQFSELPIDDYIRIVRVFVSLGIEKVRITGGEPLLRRELLPMVEQLSAMSTCQSGKPLDVAITTNGHLLARLAQPLKDAGLSRVTVSMDAVDRDKFARITRVSNGYEAVLAGIRTAKGVGLEPVKVNAVIMRGFNEDQIVPFARFSRDEGVIVRFIEFMPLEEERIWAPDTVIGFNEMLDILNNYRPLVPLPATSPGETAMRYTFDDGCGEVGIIAPVSKAFCGACSRVRLTSDGKIRTCLFSQFDHDLHAVLLRGGTDAEVATFIEKTIQQKESRHHIGEPEFLKPSRSMVHIGG
jgi:cyclic pyranopterin phosphate synthase